MYVYSVDGRCPLRDSFVICKSLVCIKFLKMIVIFSESPQTFTWGGSQNLLFIFRSFAFCMTERLTFSVVDGRGQWSMVGGQWSVVGGQWSVVSGRRSVVGG